LQSRSKYLFEDTIELGGVRLTTKDGRIYGEIMVQVENEDISLKSLLEKVFEKADEVASLLTLHFGEGFAIEDFKPDFTMVDKKKEDGVEIEIRKSLKFYAETFLSIEKKVSKKGLSKIESELKELLGKLSKLERGEDLLRAIKWWRKGYLEEDGVDKFLDYYIAFEILASIMGYNDRHEDWVKKLSEKYSITYKPDGRISIDEIRNRLMHTPDPEKDKAEELAKQCADRFGKELLEAIRKIIDESTS